MAFWAEVGKAVEVLTPARILKAFRGRIKVEGISIVSACDFKKANLTF